VRFLIACLCLYVVLCVFVTVVVVCARRRERGSIEFKNVSLQAATTIGGRGGGSDGVFLAAAHICSHWLSPITQNKNSNINR
jgi:hypothetical protein